MLKLVFIGKNQRGEIIGRLGEQMLPQQLYPSRENAARAAFRGPGVARWPHPSGRCSWFDDSPISSTGFLGFALGFDETAFDCYLQPLDLGEFFSTDFQPL